MTNLMLGCIASVYAFFDSGLVISAGLILVAVVIDFFDGFIARFLRATSELGKQLDTLADMISFGFVPGIIMYKMLAISYQPELNTFDIPYLLFFAGFAITIFAALRLARFNLAESSDEFKGLPTPAAAILVISLPLILKTDIVWLHEIIRNSFVLYGLIFMICWLMVSPLKMVSLKFKSFNWKENTAKYAVIIGSVAILAIFYIIGGIYASLPFVIILYILISIMHHIIQPKENNEIQS